MKRSMIIFGLISDSCSNDPHWYYDWGRSRCSLLPQKKSIACTHVCMLPHHTMDVCSQPSYLMGTNLHFTEAFHSQEMISRTGFLFWFISSQYIGAAQMDQNSQGSVRFTSKPWSSEGSMHYSSVLLKNGELLKELLESCSAKAWALTAQGRGWKGQWFTQLSSHLRLFTPPEPLPRNWIFFVCIIFSPFHFYPAVPRNSKIKMFGN